METNMIKTECKIILEIVENTKYGAVHIYVRDNEGAIPHLLYVVNGHPDVCICLYEAKYYIHGSHTETVSSKTLNAINEALKKPCKKNGKISNWEYLCKQWKEKNGLLPQYENINKQPDYTKTSGSVTD